MWTPCHRRTSNRFKKFHILLPFNSLHWTTGGAIFIGHTNQGENISDFNRGYNHLCQFRAHALFCGVMTKYSRSLVNAGILSALIGYAEWFCQCKCLFIWLTDNCQYLMPTMLNIKYQIQVLIRRGRTGYNSYNSWENWGLLEITINHCDPRIITCNSTHSSRDSELWDKWRGKSKKPNQANVLTSGLGLHVSLFLSERTSFNFSSPAGQTHIGYTRVWKL